MRVDQLERLTDGLHSNIGQDSDGHLEPTVGTDEFYNEIDREDTVSFGDMAAALSLIVQFACASPDLKHVGGRIAAIGVLLDPTNMPHGRDTLSAIARECGITRAGVSKWMNDFRDQIGTSLTVGKRASVRSTIDARLLEAFKNGTHASFKRKKNAAA